MTDADRYDIDVGTWARTLLANWWIVVGLVVIGIIAGAVVTFASPKLYDATSSVYIGQTTDANGNPISSLNSNVKSATELLSSQVVLDQAAKLTGMGMTPGRLRRETTVTTPTMVLKSTSSVVNIVVITVSDPKRVRSARAANSLATVLIAHISTGAQAKIALLESQLAAGKKALAASFVRSDQAQAALDALAKQGGSAAGLAGASAPYVAIVQAAASEQDTLLTTNQKTELMLITSRQVELPRLLHEAGIPDSASGPKLSFNVAAGALAGLVIGIILAFVRARVRPAEKPALAAAGAVAGDAAQAAAEPASTESAAAESAPQPARRRKRKASAPSADEEAAGESSGPAPGGSEAKAPDAEA